MSDPLPYGGVRFLPPIEARPIAQQFMEDGGRNIPSDGPIGYFLEVDLRIPPAMHAYFSEFPVLPVKRPVIAEEYSSYRGVGSRLPAQDGEKLYKINY